jgi:hypothetical protein
LIDYPDNCTSVCPAGGGACPVDCGDDCTPTIIDHCTNGKQDCDETGVDVGGSCGGVCGDGTLQGIEQCESPFDSCCDSSTCMFKTSGTECRAASDDCDVAETCTGSSAACPSNSYQPSGTVCRPSTDLTCDPEETCTGSSAVCPTDDSSGTEGIPCGTQSCDANDGCDENNIYYDYLDCTLLCSSGSCESSCGCLSFDTYDCSDCSCSYCGFNQEESAENDDTCSDGIDNDCNGRVDGEEFLCPDNTMSFSGDLMYSTGNPVANSRIEVRVNDGLGFKKSTYNETDSNGHFVVTLLNLPTSIMNAEFDLSIYVVGEVEAIYECHYDTIDEKCD